MIIGIAARDDAGEVYAVRLGGILRASRVDPDLSRVTELGYRADVARPPCIRLDA
jgi:hypothetical protein